MSRPPSPRRLWWLMVVFVGCYYSLFAFFPGMFLFVGVNHFGVWFLDTYALLATNDAMSFGLDPYAYNPFDPFGRPHVYPHWWLYLHNLGLTRADNFLLGGSFVLAFFLAAIARLRPRAGGELLWYLAIFCSSPILLALNRANNDLAVFALLAPVVPCLLSPRRAWRLGAILLIALATSLKFYPAVAALVLLTGDDRREVRERVAVGVLAMGLVALNLADDFVRFSKMAPKAEGLMTFGAANLFAALGLVGWQANVAALAVAATVFIGFWRSKIFSEWRIDDELRGAWLSFVLGAVLLAGCFFSGRNYAYRWVFALWLAPLLWRLPRDRLAPLAVRRLAQAIAVLLMLALWIDPAVSVGLGFVQGRVPSETIMRWADRVFLCEQPIAWLLFAGLLGFLAHFTRQGVRTLLSRG